MKSRDGKSQRREEKRREEKRREEKKKEKESAGIFGTVLEIADFQKIKSSTFLGKDRFQGFGIPWETCTLVRGAMAWTLRRRLLIRKKNAETQWWACFPIKLGWVMGSGQNVQNLVSISESTVLTQGAPHGSLELTDGSRPVKLMADFVLTLVFQWSSNQELNCRFCDKESAALLARLRNSWAALPPHLPHA